MAHQIGNAVDLGWSDKRRALSAGANDSTATTSGVTTFTANATGTTTTIVGANAAPGTSDANTIRRGERFKLFTSAGILKEEKVFTVTGIAVAASTTVTFTPAAATAPVSGDIARRTTFIDFRDENRLDSRLTTLGYTASQLSLMSQNDKVYALRYRDDPAGI